MHAHQMSTPTHVIQGETFPITPEPLWVQDRRVWVIRINPIANMCGVVADEPRKNSIPVPQRWVPRGLSTGESSFLREEFNRRLEEVEARRKT